jgi:hypothetical protein
MSAQQETNDVVIATLYAEVTKMISGCRSKDDFKLLFEQFSGNKAPDTSFDWLKEAVVRLYQQRFYAERGMEVSALVKKNDQAFFSAPLPTPDLVQEKKENAMKDKKEKTEKVEGEKKNKNSGTVIALKAGSNIDDLIKKQKTEHVVVLMTLVKEAGEKGTTMADLIAAVPGRLKDKSTWEKYKPSVHINYVLKKLSEFVTVTTPASS